MCSSPEPADARIAPAALLERVRTRLDGGVLLIDGRSGSGKTTLAAWLAPRLGARVLHLEDLYCGWDGLDEAADVLARRVLPAFARGRVATWPRWDWAADRVDGSGSLRPGGRLIVEGCGALTAASRPLAGFALLLDVDPAVRAERILRRDPPSALPGHRRWARQERRQLAREPMPALADLVLRGGVRLPTRSEGSASGLR
ncbi:MAG TPA: AAA family ATPase [Amnibacterium sp.]|nr:AAA family ATPase [Amnibacterium sp.]